jgi:membrane protease YdiL (CAAX protease family)
MNSSEIIEELSKIAVVDVVIFAAGVFLFTRWLYKTSLGKNALAESLPRRNNMPPYMPIIPLIIWLGGVAVAVSAVNKFFPGLANWQSVLVDNVIVSIGSIITIAVIIFLVRATFARRTKGFGLDVRTIPKDLLAAAGSLLAVWPVLTMLFLTTVFLGQLIYGPDFQIQKHEELELLTSCPQVSVRVVIVVAAVLIIPVIEEMLFRGLFQTMIRSYMGKPWTSIAASSLLFTAAHTNAAHWPVLLALAMCLGYSYEKSGSLFRPIFIHIFFNASSIIATLYSV